ncbi:MAG: YcgL domain-containing protein [Thiogranum sp.]|nr:YcgL domain-containing protein [Thiogranum sp.]
MHCVVYKSLRQFDYYLFVRRDDALTRVPEGLKQMLGSLEKVIDLELDSARTLAQADVAEVMRQITAQGYYLQMPKQTAEDQPVA